MAKRAWVDSVLTDASFVTLVDNRTNEDRENVRERMLQGGHKMTITTLDTTTENNDGRHAVGVADGLGNVGEFNIFAFDGTTKGLTVTDTGHANPQQIIAETGWKFVGTNVTTGAQPGHTHIDRRTILIPFAQGPVVGNIETLVQMSLATGETATIVDVRLAVLTAADATLEIDVAKKNAAVPAFPTDSIFQEEGTAPTITSGNNFGNSTSFDTSETTVVDGDVFIAKVLQDGGAASDLTVHIDIDVVTK